MGSRPRACHTVALLQALPPHQRRVRLGSRSSIKCRHAGQRSQGSVPRPTPCGGQVISVSHSQQYAKSCRSGYAVLRRYGASRIIGQCTSVRPSPFLRFSPRCAPRPCATRTFSAGRSVVLGPSNHCKQRTGIHKVHAPDCPAISSTSALRSGLGGRSLMRGR